MKTQRRNEEASALAVCVMSPGFLHKSSRLLVGLLAEGGAETATGTMLLKTLFNLSFDPLIRTEMIDSGILGQVTDVAKIPSLRKVSEGGEALGFLLSRQGAPWLPCVRPSFFPKPTLWR